MEKQAPNIMKYDNIKYVFIKKIKDNMYLYKSLRHGFNITFNCYDLGLIEKDYSRKKSGNSTRYSY
jgi:hypothetical protein